MAKAKKVISQKKATEIEESKKAVSKKPIAKKGQKKKSSINTDTGRPVIPRETPVSAMVTEDAIVASKPPVKTSGFTAPSVAGKVATLSITFFSADPGLSKLTAILNADLGTGQTVDRTGKFVFKVVQRGDIIDIMGQSNGKTVVTIDIPANSQREEFPAGRHIDFSFIII
jgi:hypothetical protein